MSAALAWDVDPDPTAPSTRPFVAGRPRLHLVPTGPHVDAPRVHVQVTRSGRLVRTALVVSVALALTWTAVTALSAAAAGHHSTTVVSGQTLSQIAATELPDLPISDGVVRIQLANGLSSSEIHAGQLLQIPAH